MRTYACICAVHDSMTLAIFFKLTKKRGRIFFVYMLCCTIHCMCMRLRMRVSLCEVSRMASFILGIILNILNRVS